MSEKHLGKGSECPPVTPDLLRCYSMKFCPYAQRTRLVLAAKGIEHEIVNICLNQKPEWFVEKNPLQKVPTLEINGKLMFESLVTCDYLDEAYSEYSLHQNDPWCKGEDRIFMELFGKVSSPMYKVYSSYVKGETEELHNAVQNIKNGLDTFEKELGKRGSKYFDGEKAGMLDYMVWPWFERLPVIEMMLGENFLENCYPTLKKWMEDMKQDQAVKAVYISPEIHKEFLVGAFAGKPDYDMKVC